MALFLIHFLAFHHYNEFTVEDRFNSAQLIIVEEPICLRQLDVDTLFTNISPDENINACINNLYNLGNG